MLIVAEHLSPERRRNILAPQKTVVGTFLTHTHSPTHLPSSELKWCVSFRLVPRQHIFLHTIQLLISRWWDCSDLRACTWQCGSWRPRGPPKSWRSKTSRSSDQGHSSLWQDQVFNLGDRGSTSPTRERKEHSGASHGRSFSHTHTHTHTPSTQF